MLPAALAVLVALGPLLRGAWDVWAQSVVLIAVCCGVSAWLAFRVCVGYVPLPSTRRLRWAAALFLLGGLSACLSPVHALCLPAWYALLGSLWIFLAMSALSKDERFYVDEAIRAAAWVLMVLAVYQRLRLGDDRPASALVNANIWAGAVLLFLAMAVEKKDWLLAAGLLLSLWWTKSVGAWLGLFCALGLSAGRRRAWSTLGALGALACLILVYNKFQSPEVLNRWQWWKTAIHMAYDRPLLGYGPGAFAYVLPAYRESRGLGAVYAHQFFLQTAAEYGLPFTLIYFAGLWHCLQKGPSPKRFGALAVLIHSLWDWTLSMPANLWLFSYFAASSISEGSRGVNVPARWKIPSCLAVAVSGFLLVSRIWTFWSADRAKAAANEALVSGDAARASASASLAARLSSQDAEAALLAAMAEITAAAGAQGEEERAALERAAVWLERAAALNPFRAPTWTELSLLYRRLGRPAEAEAALRRGAKWCVRLRGQGAG